jgi:hypothetical protein
MRDHSVWLDQLLIHLGHSGPQGQAALQFLVKRGVKVMVHNQPTAARWTLTGNIQLHPRYTERAPEDPYPISLVVHEVRHLEQGFFTALSVYGELDAWQHQFSLIKSFTGQYHLEGQYNEILSKLMSLDLGWDRGMLARARSLMQDYAGADYRIDLLPLYPLPQETFFIGTHKRLYII